MHKLSAKELNAVIPPETFQFETTASLLSGISSRLAHEWLAQSEAYQTAMFGLRIPQKDFNLLVLGAQGSGRTTLMREAMLSVAKSSAGTNWLLDLVAVYHFDLPDQPMYLKLPVGKGAQLRSDMEAFVRNLMMELPQMMVMESQVSMLARAEQWLNQQITDLQTKFHDTHNPSLMRYFGLIPGEVVGYLKNWQPTSSSDAENMLESFLNEAFFSRFRVNVLVDRRNLQQQEHAKPVIYDQDPSLNSLFGLIDTSNEALLLPEFIRLKAGNLHQADGGMLMLHLRDLINDEQNGQQIIEKLHRFLRNGALQIEDHNSQNTMIRSQMSVPVSVKLVLVATREDFYDCLDQQPDFFAYFPIKVEFQERILATHEHYHRLAEFIAHKCNVLGYPHFTKQAVIGLILTLQRLEEDQIRISTNVAFLEQMLIESAAFAGDSPLVDIVHVNAAIEARAKRNQYFETQIRDSIIDNELLIQVHGSVVGQVNGLTHIELGDASFGSPIRITARCYPGKSGLINIDREVNMSGPNHDKGIFILQNWLSASFWHLAPLSLNASLVFEQEYNGVEGDSASSAELFALLSALTGLPIKQGLAVTGALNQFGEVMPIGGVNEKIEGYFRVCQSLGLDGQQGVIIPKRNQRHLLLQQEVIDAVAEGKFHIITIDHVLEGIAYLTGIEAGIQDPMGFYSQNSVMGYAQSTLASYRKTFESNQSRIEGSH